MCVLYFEVESLYLEGDAGFVPVISPIGTDKDGNTYNINADYAASAVAGALNAQKLVFITDVDGIMRDKDDTEKKKKKLTIHLGGFPIGTDKAAYRGKGGHLHPHP